MANENSNGKGKGKPPVPPGQNEAPSDILLNGTSVDELALGAVIGTLTVVDPNTGDTFTYIVSDDRFEIVDGVLRLKSGITLDYESEPSISLDITATDAGGLSVTRTFMISVVDVNEAPTSIALDGATVAENADGAAIGSVLVSDPDDPDAAFGQHSYAVSDERFEVVGGELRLKAGYSLDYETESIVTIEVTASDGGGLSVEQSFVVTVANVAEAPAVADDSNWAQAGAVGHGSGAGVQAGEPADRFTASGNVLADNDHTVKDGTDFNTLVGTAGATFADAADTDPDVGDALRVVSVNGAPVADSVTVADTIPVGGEFQVNTQSTDNQYKEPTLKNMAGLADGGYVIAWASTGQDGSGRGIYAQRYNANGDAAGSEFKVNTATTNDQFTPSVAALEDGGFVVAWTSSGQDGSAGGVYAQRYDATGAPVSTEFRANTTTAGDQSYGSVVALADGGFVIVWNSVNQDGSGFGVFGQRYDAAGTAVGGEFQVNTHTANHQVVRSAAGLSDGGFVVVWESAEQDGGGYGIYGQRYDATGNAVDGEFQVNSFTVGNQNHAAVAGLEDGGFVVAWQSSGQDGSGKGVYVQRYDASGAPVGGEVQIAVGTGLQNYSSVAALADGGYVVAYENGGNIYTRRFDADGNEIGSQIVVDSFPGTGQRFSTVAELEDGGFVVNWASNNQDGSNYGIYAQRYQVVQPGIPVGTEIQGQWGTLTIFEDGSYSYRIDETAPLDPQNPAGDRIVNLAEGQVGPVETFAYTVADSTGLESIANLSIALVGRNDGPTASAGQSFQIAENSGAGTPVGTVLAADPDAGAQLSYAIVAGNDSGAFAIDAATGQITVADPSALDYESNPSFDLTVEVTDGALTDTTLVTVALDDVAEDPIAADDTNMVLAGTVAHGSGEGDQAAAPSLPATGNVIGAGGTTPPSTGDGADANPGGGTLAVVLVEHDNGNDAVPDADGETIVGQYGTLTLLSDGSYSYDLDDAHPDVVALGEGGLLGDGFTYTVSSGAGLDDTAELTITIVGANDGPTAADDANQVQAGSLAYGDQPEANVPAPVQGNVISGLGSPNTAEDSDPEGDPIAVTHVDGVAVDDAQNPLGTQIAGQHGTLTMFADGSYSYDLDDQNASVIALAAGATLDESFAYTVADPGGKSDTATLTIAIQGANDGPADLQLSNNAIAENLPGAAIGTLAAADPDTGASLTYSIMPGLDGSLFGISGNVLQVAGQTGFDYEADTSHTVRIRATDQYGAYIEQDFTIEVLDRVEAALTMANDTFAGTAESEQLFGTALTLNNGDSLSGGDGFDSLLLYGPGAFRIDQLSGFSGFEEIRLINFTTSNATLLLRDGVDISVFGSGVSDSVYLSTGHETIDGGAGDDSFWVLRAGVLTAGDVLDGGTGTYDRLQISGLPNGSIVDLRPVSVQNIENLSSYINGILLVDDASLADFTSINNYSTTRLQTSEASLDLTGKTLSNVMVESTNATGTVFTVNSANTGFFVQGGPGEDTLVANGFSFTAEQRDAIFASTSIETIIDSEGTHSAPPIGDPVFTLTTSADTLAANADDTTVNGSEATLNNNDSLHGGDGTDVLVLDGPGIYHIDQLSGFSGFEEINLVNDTASASLLFLRDGINIAVVGSNARDDFYLSTGQETIDGGAGNDNFHVTRPGVLSAGDELDGGEGADRLNFVNQPFGSVDLRPVGMQNIEQLLIFGSDFSVVLVDDANLIDVTTIVINSQNVRLQTSDATLDLRGKSFQGSSLRIESINPDGTVFTVDNYSVTSFIYGGPGVDTVVADGFTFTPTQRDGLFTHSIEIIRDASGTYGGPGDNVLFGTDAADAMFGGAGHDTLIGAAGDDHLEGGEGGDTYHVGNGSGADTIFDLAGADTLLVSAYPLTLDAGRSADGEDLVLRFGVDGEQAAIQDHFNGNPIELVQFDVAGVLPASAPLFAYQVASDPNESAATTAQLIVGTDGADIIAGGARGDFLFGGADADDLQGNGGDDLIEGGAGADLIDGGAQDGLTWGVDFASYRNSPDGVTVTLIPGGVIAVGSGGDAEGDQIRNIEGVIGSDWIDTLTGSNAGERFMGRGGDDIINGMGGFDYVLYHDSPDGVIVNLGAGPVDLGALGQIGAGTAFDGWGGTDALTSIEAARGSQHDDILLGSDRLDTTEQFRGAEGDDIIDGRLGNDMVDYIVAGGAIYVDLTDTNDAPGDYSDATLGGYALDGDGGTDRLFGIEQIRGGVFDDTFIGSSGNNLFQGLAGNDSMDGGDGVDTVDYSLDFFLQGGAGVVVNLGSSDVDFGAPGVVAANSATDGFGDADALFNIENVFGTGQADTIVGNAAGNTLLGLGGNDRLAGGAGNDLLDGGVGTQDQADYSLDAGLGGGAGVTVDLAAGTATDGFGSTDTLANIEWVVGTNEADGISGNAASNRFEGLAGSDTLDGRGGSDVLNGGAGDDILIGGGDDDLFVFEDGTGNDTVTDYAPGADRLDVSAFYADFATLETQIEDVDGNAVIHLDADDSVTLIGIQKVQLQSTDFVFLDG